MRAWQDKTLNVLQEHVITIIYGTYTLTHVSSFKAEQLSRKLGPVSLYPKRRFIVRSREVSKSRDLYLELFDRSEIWQAHRQHCCRCACQISKRYVSLKYQSRGFETSRDLTIRRLFGYWDGSQVPFGYTKKRFENLNMNNRADRKAHFLQCYFIFLVGQKILSFLSNHLARGNISSRLVINILCSALHHQITSRKSYCIITVGCWFPTYKFRNSCSVYGLKNMCRTITMKTQD